MGLFGTDGVRGLANRDLTAELALDLSVAAAHVLADSGEFAGHRPRAIVGRDTRASGEFLEAAVVAGLASAGIDVTLVGALPTPAVAFLVASMEADLGVMLSASHNPMPDNGIKFFARGGVKLDDALEVAIEIRMREPWDRPVGADVGRVVSDPSASDLFVSHLLSTLETDAPLAGVKLVVDCANGAASVVGPEALRRAGAEVIAIHAAPNGLNINEGCGSTHLDDLRAAVVEHGADAGVAFDGDADRCLAIDASGNDVDGDHILGILAISMSGAGTLTHGTVVSTVMANLGFNQAMDSAGITVISTAVGDRYVLESMRENGFVLGGEQSGHVVMSEFGTTGDGVLTALHLLARVASTGKSLAALAGVVTKLPQVLINVGGVDRNALESNARVSAELELLESALDGSGRILLRPSGTEPVIRVMVEAESEVAAQRVAEQLARVITAELGLQD
ncbi:MAG: phosphoglucosamine mutase [Actinomycetia bacterium]|nr:phosphoglucosamine mutase [Actinomycetes bacterium]